MSNGDEAREPPERIGPRYDNWPVERYDTYADWPVERATPGDDDDDTVEELEKEYEQDFHQDKVDWLGITGSGTPEGGPSVYAGVGSAIHTGRIDEANERVVLEAEANREVEDEESLGEHIEEIGEEHGWQWLSSFAREHLGADDPEDALADDAFRRRDSEFDRRNLAESDDADLGFFASHTLVDGTGQVYIIDRRFDVTTRAAGVAVAVEGEYLVAREPAEEERAGDTDLVAERSYEFDLSTDTDDPGWEAEVETYLMEWHADHVGWPPSEADE